MEGGIELVSGGRTTTFMLVDLRNTDTERQSAGGVARSDRGHLQQEHDTQRP
jgi:hypothetical protein